MIATVVIGDGRLSYLQQAIASYESQVTHADDALIMVNDTGDPFYSETLDTAYPDWHMVHQPQRSGLAGALCAGWCAALDTDADYVLHVEEDFTFISPIDALPLTHILNGRPLLAQLSLKRNPVNETERSVGGYIQCAPNAYWQQEGYVSHSVVFTFNPSLIPRRVIELCINEPGDGLEHGFTETLLAHGYSFGIFGTIDDPPRVTHIGNYRSQEWRL